MLKKLQKQQQGFTIIEVMIVLVIAAVILLIVFLAVPALQRNSRNTQRKNDVSRVGTAVNNYVSNNNGAVFPTAGLAGAASLNQVKTDVGPLGQYTLVVGTNFGGATGAVAGNNLVNNITVVTGAQCDPAGGGGTLVGAARAMALQYAIETPSSSGANPTGTALCQNI